MGLKIKNPIKSVGNFFSNVGKSVSGAVKDAGHDIKKEAGKTLGDVMRGAAATASFGTSEALGIGKTISRLYQYGIDELNGTARAERKKAKANDLAALNAQAAADKAAADADYYKRVMAARDKQVAAYMDSQTDMTSDGESLGDYGKKLGTFGDAALGGKKKKMYY